VLGLAGAETGGFVLLVGGLAAARDAAPFVRQG
jgi:hypothetical protein